MLFFFGGGGRAEAFQSLKEDNADGTSNCLPFVECFLFSSLTSWKDTIYCLKRKAAILFFCAGSCGRANRDEQFTINSVLPDSLKTYSCVLLFSSMPSCLYVSTWILPHFVAFYSQNHQHFIYYYNICTFLNTYEFIQQQKMSTLKRFKIHFNGHWKIGLMVF